MDPKIVILQAHREALLMHICQVDLRWYICIRQLRLQISYRLLQEVHLHFLDCNNDFSAFHFDHNLPGNRVYCISVGLMKNSDEDAMPIDKLIGSNFGIDGISVFINVETGRWSKCIVEHKNVVFIDIFFLSQHIIFFL